MSEKFLNMDNDKKERILNAAMDEFAALGYDKASTNTIVKNACISKGLLFHYFGSKKKLYVFIYNYGFDLLMEKFGESINYDETDILKLLADIIWIKMKMIKIYPNIFNFFMSCYVENSPELKDEIDVVGDSRRYAVYEKIFKDIDYSLFKEGIDVGKAINVIKWTFEQYGTEYVNNLTATGKELDPEDVLKEVNSYVDMFRICFYKVNPQKVV